MKKLSSINRFTQPHLVPTTEKRYIAYDAYHKKDLIMKYIQVSVACLVAIIVIAGLYNLSR